MRIFVAAAALCAAFVPVHAMAASPFDGTWKQDIASAKMSQEPDAYVLTGGMSRAKAVFRLIRSRRTAQINLCPAIRIRIWWPSTRPMRNNIVLTDKKNGKTTETLTFKVAPNGRTIDVDFKGTSENGASYSGHGRAPSGSPRVPRVQGPFPARGLRTGLTNASDSIVTTTTRSTARCWTMTDPTGDTTRQKMDETEAPVKGNPGITTVTVKKNGSGARSWRLTSGTARSSRPQSPRSREMEKR